MTQWSFDWDEHNLAKCVARVPRAEIERMFGDRATYLAVDPHMGETRYRAMGRSTSGRPLFIVFTLRRIAGGLVIRPISARYAHKKEVMRWPTN
jgi:uncharacterized DUF497 family protein